MEHHSNILPWRQQPCRVEVAGIDRSDGALNLRDLEARLSRHRGRVRVVSLIGASNVTGEMPPIRRVARLAHEHGAWFVVDATQLVPHRKVSMGSPDDPERIDFLAFSAHKMYAPFGGGALVGPKSVFEEGPPDSVGGGTVLAVSDDSVVWHHLPEKEEAGTPNVVGALALARAARAFEEIGMDNLAEHERNLTRYCLETLLGIEGIKLFGRRDPQLKVDRLGVFAIEAAGIPHGLLAAVLGYEWGIGVRNGCFCAQPYVRELLGVEPDEMKRAIEKLSAGDHTTIPGLVRISLGLYNTRDEIDYLAEALRSIVSDGPKAHYVLHPEYRDYVPEGWEADLDHYVPF
jgi:selenocysteine lyase/cysteine desulfurase